MIRKGWKTLGLDPPSGDETQEAFKLCGHSYIFYFGRVHPLVHGASFFEFHACGSNFSGVSEFVFVQWLAPFLSEFPEQLSAYRWAASVDKAPMALSNFVSSSINQWTI